MSYLSIVLQTLSAFILTRIYLDILGDDGYGLYQMIYAVAQYILILDLGISTVMIRYISEFDATGQKDKIENFAFHFALIVAAVVIVIAAIGLVVNQRIENIYQTLTPDEYAISHKLFRTMIFQLCFTVISHYFKGVCEAYERFTFTRIVSILQLCLSFVLTVGFLYLGVGVTGIALANTIAIAASTIALAICAFTKIELRICFHHWDFDLLKPAFLLMLAMLLQAVVGHVNGSVDKTILGIMATKKDVTVYSIAASIITMFNTIPTVISGVFQSEAVRLVAKRADSERLTDFVIRPGRLQFMLIGGFLAGFFLLGQDFIICWTDKTSMSAAWGYVLIIMIPNAVPLVQTPCLSILNAMDKRIYRSIILAGMTGINILLTVILIRLIGPIGAPIATGISYIIGHCILMNVYYKKRIGLNVRRMFKEITHKTVFCVGIAFAINLPLMLWRTDGNWFVLLSKAAVFCVSYGLLLWKVSMNDDERKMAEIIFAKLRNNLI